MGDLISSLTTAISLAQRLNEISKHIQNAEFKNLLADLNLELADTKLKLANIIDENAKLKQELTEAKHSKGQVPHSLVFKNGLYFTEEDDGPYCPGCYDSKGQQIRITKQKPPFNRFGDYQCPTCKQFF